MKKTYITTMPDHIGSFLKASECFASLGVNITRVSYNKAIDTHTLFIDAEGDEVQLSKADEELGKIGYLLSEKNENSIVLLEFMLKDIPGSVTKVLRLIHDWDSLLITRRDLKNFLMNHRRSVLFRFWIIIVQSGYLITVFFISLLFRV